MWLGTETASPPSFLQQQGWNGGPSSNFIFNAPSLCDSWQILYHPWSSSPCWRWREEEQLPQRIVGVRTNEVIHAEWWVWLPGPQRAFSKYWLSLLLMPYNEIRESFDSWVYECPVLALTEYHNCSGLNNRNSFCHSSEG